MNFLPYQPDRLWPDDFFLDNEPAVADLEHRSRHGGVFDFYHGVFKLRHLRLDDFLALFEQPELFFYFGHGKP